MKPFRTNIYRAPIYQTPKIIRRAMRNSTQHTVCSLPSIVEQSEIIGRGLIIFVFTVAVLNWTYYRNIRKQIEDQDASKKK